MSAAIRMTVTWHVLPQESGPIAGVMHELMLAARAQPGCLSCSLATHLGERVGFHYVEEWKDELDLRRQLGSSRFAKLAELMERGTGQPRVEFALPGGVRSLDYAEEVRREQREPA